MTGEDAFHQTYPAISMVINLMDGNNTAQMAEILMRKNFVEVLQEGFMVLLRVNHNHYWDEIFRNWIQLLSNFIACGD